MRSPVIESTEANIALFNSFVRLIKGSGGEHTVICDGAHIEFCVTAWNDFVRLNGHNLSDADCRDLLREHENCTPPRIIYTEMLCWRILDINA